MDDKHGRYCPERSRPTSAPGGNECVDCGCIFIGAEWHARCSCCEEMHKRAQRDAQRQADWHEELRRDSFGDRI